jgi:hypothetical protein
MFVPVISTALARKVNYLLRKKNTDDLFLETAEADEQTCLDRLLRLCRRVSYNNSKIEVTKKGELQDKYIN